ncbi:MAG: AAA family ATPase [Rhizobacter sp.]|nr:AAA family ATPase [Rhizobacter sp.]
MAEPDAPHQPFITAIAALEAQRALLGDAVVDAALAPLRRQLAALQAAAPQRRLVTVLFLDVVGSTALSSTLDPEDVHDIMDSALQRFSDLVLQRGGKVLQYAGDSLLAAFGSEAAREDDAERAVLAGLDLLAEAQAQAGRVQRLHGRADFGVRVGAHTGQVLLGGGVDEEGTIRGFTVNIAARLEQAAVPGTLRISQDTWRHVRGVFEVEAQPPLTVKGQNEPLRTYLVLRARPRAFRVATRGVEGVETPLVGRDTELAQLVATFEDTLRTRSLHAVTLLAQAGLGKSRLMQELQHRLDTHRHACWLLLGRSQPSSALQPYGLLRDVLAWRLQIADSDSAEVARHRLVEGLAPHLGDDGETQAELLGLLIGMDFSASPRLAGVLNEPRLLRDRAFAAFIRYVERLAATDGAPVVVMLLDDLQWADDASLDWLAHLLKTPALPLALVMAARPALIERRPAWGAAAAPHARIGLSALDATQREALTRALLQRLPDTTAASAALRALIEAQAEGNPFYAEELVKMLIDDGVILVEGEAWRVLPERLSAAKIPGTLTGVLQARLDALAAPERRALQLASVVGPVFWDDALRTLDPNAVPNLPALQRKAMVQARSESSFEGTREEGFQHHLLHQVTYDTVLKADRRDAHACTAAWLAARVGDRQAEYLAVTAEHYERAGDMSRALDWYERAALTAVERFANQAALTCTTRMLAMPELGDSRRRLAVVRQQIAAADLLGDRPRHRAAVDEATRLADVLCDDALRASAAIGQALLADRLGDRATAWTLAQRAAELAERAGAAGTAALAHAELSWVARERGNLALAHHHIDIALPFATRAAQQMVHPQDNLYEVSLRLVAAQLHLSEFDFDAALVLTQEARRLAEQRQLRRLLCSCHEGLARWGLDMLDAELAVQHLDATAAIAQDIGQTEILGSVTMLRARLAFWQGDDADIALALTQEAEAVFVRIGARHYRAECLGVRAEMLARSGELAAARNALQGASELYAAMTADADVRACRLLIADTWREAGDLAQALALVEAELPALGEAGALDGASAALPARMALWRVLKAGGDARAPRQLELAVLEQQRQTEKIGDSGARHRVLEGLALHREITAAWASPGA